MGWGRVDGWWGGGRVAVGWTKRVVHWWGGMGRVVAQRCVEKTVVGWCCMCTVEGSREPQCGGKSVSAVAQNSLSGRLSTSQSLTHFTQPRKHTTATSMARLPITFT